MSYAILCLATVHQIDMLSKAEWEDRRWMWGHERCENKQRLSVSEFVLWVTSNSAGHWRTLLACEWYEMCI